MKLGSLVARLGLHEVARRLGVTEGTVKRWIASGVSPRAVGAVAGVVKRHVAARKAAKASKKAKAFRQEQDAPEESELPEKAVLPGRPPRPSDVKAKDEGVEIRKRGSQPLQTDRYTGSTTTYTVSKPITDVDDELIVDTTLRLWDRIGRTFVRVIFLFFRYIPFNPLYRGELMKKQGKWFDWWASTEAMSTARSITDRILYALQAARRAAMTRVIWLEQFQVQVFDAREDAASWKTVMARRLR